MKKYAVMLAAVLFAGLCVSVSCAEQVSVQEFSESVKDISLDNLEELFSRAGRHGSERGDPEAQYKLGVFFWHLLKASSKGLDPELNSMGAAQAKTSSYEQMMYWLKCSADQGYAQAQFMLGYMCYHAMPLLKDGAMYDTPTMQRWYESAAKNGHARAQAHLADSYLVMTPGVPNSMEKALSWAKASAEQGDAYGMFVLSKIYGREDSPVYDPVKAAEWHKKAREAAGNDPAISFSD